MQLLCCPRAMKTAREVTWLHHAMTESNSIGCGRPVARRLTQEALQVDVGPHSFFADNAECHFLRELLSYDIERAQ